MALHAPEQLANIPIVAHETARLAQALRNLLTVGRADVTEKMQSAALTITGHVERGKQLGATLFRAY